MPKQKSIMQFAGGESVRLDDYSNPRFRASASTARVPREAAELWQTDDTDFGEIMRMWPAPEYYPHTKATKQMQAYFRRKDVPRTVGETIVYKGMDPGRLDKDQLMATSTRSAVAFHFANAAGSGMVYKISIPPGTPFMPIPPSDELDEHELLFPPGSLQVTGEAVTGVEKMGERLTGGRYDPPIIATPAVYKPRLSRAGRPSMNLKGSTSVASTDYSSCSADISQQSTRSSKNTKRKDTASSSRTPQKKTKTAEKTTSAASSKTSSSSSSASGRARGRARGKI